MSAAWSNPAVMAMVRTMVPAIRNWGHTISAEPAAWGRGVPARAVSARDEGVQFGVERGVPGVFPEPVKAGPGDFGPVDDRVRGGVGDEVAAHKLRAEQRGT